MRYLLKVIIFAVVYCLCSSNGLTQEANLKAFQKIDFEKASEIARKTEKIMVIDFFATWCEPCKRLDKETWHNSEVQKWLSDNAVSVKIDIDDNKELTEKYKVESYPSVLFLDSMGKEFYRVIGYREPNTFLSEAKISLLSKEINENIGKRKVENLGKLSRKQTFLIWRVGSFYNQETPQHYIPKEFTNNAMKLGYSIKEECFPAIGFIEKFYKKIIDNEEPDFLVFDNYGILDGAETGSDDFIGIESCKTVYKSLIDVSNAFKFLYKPNERGGWVNLVSSSPNYIAAKSLAISLTLGKKDYRLSFHQISELANLKIEDSKLAQQIEQRGVGFYVSRETIENLQKIGLGNKSAKALDAYIIKELPKNLSVTDTLYISSWYGEGLYKVNVNEGKIVSNLATKAYNSNILTCNNTQNEMYVSTFNKGILSIIKSNPLQEAGFITQNIGKHITAMAVSLKGDAIYLISYEDEENDKGRRLVKVDTKTRQVTTVVKFHKGGFFAFLAISPDGKKLYISCDKYIYVYDSDLNVIEQSVFENWYSRPIQISKDGEYLYTIQTGLLIKLRAKDCSVEKSVKLTNSLPMLKISENTGNLWVGARNSIYEISPSLDTLKQIKLVTHPYCFIESSNSIYLYIITQQDRDAGTVSVLNTYSRKVIYTIGGFNYPSDIVVVSKK